jgi:hypothetical protein
MPATAATYSAFSYWDFSTRFGSLQRAVWPMVASADSEKEEPLNAALLSHQDILGQILATEFKDNLLESMD